jgi:hypothetical protein
VGAGLGRGRRRRPQRLSRAGAGALELARLGGAHGLRRRRPGVSRAGARNRSGAPVDPRAAARAGAAGGRDATAGTGRGSRAGPRTRRAAGCPGVAVELRSEGSTWVDVAADDGEQRRQELRPGQNLSLQARRRLALALGDAGAVRVSVNGRDLGFIGDRGEIRVGIVFEAPPVAAAAKGRPAANQGPGSER